MLPSGQLRRGVYATPYLYNVVRATAGQPTSRRPSTARATYFITTTYWVVHRIMFPFPWPRIHFKHRSLHSTAKKREDSDEITSVEELVKLGGRFAWHTDRPNKAIPLLDYLP